MGDKDESEEEEMKMALLRPPVYPLPEEIKTMEPSETVCRFCGVSYLIFHEFQQLRDRLTALEAELQEIRGTSGGHRVPPQPPGDQHQDRRTTNTEDERLRRELGEAEAEAERLRQRGEELRSAAADREKVLSHALQEANKTCQESRKHLQQLEQRLAEDARTREEAERGEAGRREALRGVCVQQRDTLRRAGSLLAACGAELAHIRGFLSHLTGAWQLFRSQILQHSTQVFSAQRDELEHSIAECQKMSERKENLTRQLMERRRQSEEQHDQLLRLRRELAEQRERRSSCQRRCESLERGEAEAGRKRRAAEEEAALLRGDLERVRQEARCLAAQRKTLIESHSKTLTKVEEDYKQLLASKLATALDEERAQNALRVKELELEARSIGEKNQLLLLEHQQDNAQLQRRLREAEQEVRALRDERSAEEERQRTSLEELEKRKEAELHARLQEAARANCQLQAEVAFLQETVSRECEEREELTAALRHAQSQLGGLRSAAWHQRGAHAHTRSDVGGGSPEARRSEGSLPRLRGTSAANHRLPPTTTRKDRF